jgi:hypothetical protein
VTVLTGDPGVGGVRATRSSAHRSVRVAYRGVQGAVLLNALILSGGGTTQSLKQRDEASVAAMLARTGQDGIEKAERDLEKAVLQQRCAQCIESRPNIPYAK